MIKKFFIYLQRNFFHLAVGDPGGNGVKAESTR